MLILAKNPPFGIGYTPIYPLSDTLRCFWRLITSAALSAFRLSPIWSVSYPSYRYESSLAWLSRASTEMVELDVMPGRFLTTAWMPSCPNNPNHVDQSCSKEPAIEVFAETSDRYTQPSPSKYPLQKNRCRVIGIKAMIASWFPLLFRPYPTLSRNWQSDFWYTLKIRLARLPLRFMSIFLHLPVESKMGSMLSISSLTQSNMTPSLSDLTWPSAQRYPSRYATSAVSGWLNWRTATSSSAGWSSSLIPCILRNMKRDLRSLPVALDSWSIVILSRLDKMKAVVSGLYTAREGRIRTMAIHQKATFLYGDRCFSHVLSTS